MKLLTDHWERNKDRKVQEKWPAGNVFTNHWKSPTHMVGVFDSNLEGGGGDLPVKIQNGVKSIIEEWTGMELKEASVYGIRVYGEGAVLNPHVDRSPLVSSCIINVAQDLDEDWPLEVIDRMGRSVNITMEPGDMVLYESGSLIHGRPFPLVGRYFANIFIHFEPTGRPLGDETHTEVESQFFPPYLIPDSPWAASWADDHPNGWKKPAPSGPKQDSNSNTRETHVAAALGDVERLKEIAAKDAEALHKRDENGWHPLHESVRAGHVHATELLIERGADKNLRTGHKGDGQSPLNLALEHHNEGSPIVEYLLGIGAENIDVDEL